MLDCGVLRKRQRAGAAIDREGKCDLTGRIWGVSANVALTADDQIALVIKIDAAAIGSIEPRWRAGLP